jgi:hypothetical protein
MQSKRHLYYSSKSKTELVIPNGSVVIGLLVVLATHSIKDRIICLILYNRKSKFLEEVNNQFNGKKGLLSLKKADVQIEQKS